ncbi:S8 family serine peptidase [Spirulina subsalsa]|uniref:S8 family serine peptidase n=1 Tax=Spirulina subsalsa TaxID=54311 RepID=UPI0002FAE271|nr:S8 family serine peptidase [Spirulina subsalsa]
MFIGQLFFNLFGNKQSLSPQEETENTYFQAFILEPILTPSGLIDAGDDSSDPGWIEPITIEPLDLPESELESPSLEEVEQFHDSETELESALSENHFEIEDELEIIPYIELEPQSPFNAGVFTVGDTGTVEIDYLFDGGKYQFELAIFSLEGMEDFEPGSEAFIAEAARRALSESEFGHIVIQDRLEGAKFEGLGNLGENNNWNSGDYLGVKSFSMRPGDEFAFMLTPNGRIQEVLNNPSITGTKAPIFSLGTANPDDMFNFGQIADVTGDGSTFVMEDVQFGHQWYDGDYNDLIFQVRGATGEAPLMADLIDPAIDWRDSDLGQALINYATRYVEEVGVEDIGLSFQPEDQPLVGIIDTGFSADNPDLDYSNITLGRDWIDGDDNPLLSVGEGNEHGTHVLGIIAAQRDNDIGIDGINPDAPIWLGRAVGSGQWANSLVEFVDAAIESGQPNAVVNLSLDLTQIDAEGNVTTRYEFTPMERAAIEYARQNNVLLVVAAGNDGGVMSALGQASQEFDNIITVGAAQQFDPTASPWQGADRADYSSYGRGLDLMAYGGTTENPQLSLTGEGTSAMAGTSVATAKVTGAVSQVWAANPGLSYRQVIEILKQTATDLGETGFDLATGAGLVNMMAAVHLAKVTKPEEHSTPNILSPETWSGEGVFTPGERAVQNVVVPPEWRRWYYGWLDSSNPADTFSFRLDEPTSLQFSLDFLGSAVLRRNGQVILTGKDDNGDGILYAGANGKLPPGNYVLTVDRSNYSKVDQYRLIMNFVDGSQGGEDPVVEFLPAKQVIQPQPIPNPWQNPQPTPSPTPQPTPTPSPSAEEIAAKERAIEEVRAVYEANLERLGNSRRDIQIFEQAFDGVNMPAVQYFDGGYIIWNGQKAIPYFNGTGKALPNIDLPSTVKPIWDVVKPSNVVKVPDGRHTYPNMRGSSEYWVELNGTKNDISLAARDTTLVHPDLRTTVYRDLGGGRMQQVPLTDINSDDNYLNYKNLPPGKYLIKMDVEQNKANIPYRMIVNLDQAGDTLAKARNLDREYGKIDGKRIIVSDHVGLPQGDKDLYTFTTSNFQTNLQFAVRSLYSDLNEETKSQLLDGDIKMRLLDANGNEVFSVDSANRKPTFAAQMLKPNSKYYVEVTAKNGSRTNYDLVLNFEQLWAPAGRHEFKGLTDQLEYNFRVDSNATDRTLHTAVRDSRGQTISSIHYTSTIYRRQNGQWIPVNPTSTGNSVLMYNSLPTGEYRVVMNPKPSMPSSVYTFVHNLDQAGQTRSDARNLGNIGGKRVTVNDHVGMPTGDLDYYKFSTGSDPRLLQFAVRHPSGAGSLPLEGDVEFILYDNNGTVLKRVNSQNRNSIYDTYELKANSEYYVRIKPQSGHLGNYQLVLNAKEKLASNVGNTPNPNYLYREQDYLNTLYQDGTGNVISSRRADGYHDTGRAMDSYGGHPNSAIYALVGGEVIEAKNGKEFFGNKVLSHWAYNGTVAIYNKELNKTFIYWHLAEGSIDESMKGKTIEPGTFIGREGNTGYSFGAHTHVEVHNGRVNVNMSNRNAPQAPANSGRLHIPTIFQEAVRKGLVKLHK